MSGRARFRHLSGRAAAVVARLLGPEGRRLSYSETGYLGAYPEHLVLFDALLVIDRSAVWQGDIDVTADESALMAIASESRCEVHVLPRELASSRVELGLLVQGCAYWTDGTRSELGRTEAARFERRGGRILRQRDGPEALGA